MRQNLVRVSELAALCRLVLAGWWRVVRRGGGGQLDADGTPWTRMPAEELRRQLEREHGVCKSVRSIRRALEELAAAGCLRREQRYAHRWRQEWWYAPPENEVVFEVSAEEPAMPAALAELPAKALVGADTEAAAEAAPEAGSEATPAAASGAVEATSLAADAPLAVAVTEASPAAAAMADQSGQGCPLKRPPLTEEAGQQRPLQRPPVADQVLKTHFSFSDLLEGGGRKRNSHNPSRLDGGKGFSLQPGSLAERLQQAVERARAKGQTLPGAPVAPRAPEQPQRPAGGPQKPLATGARGSAGGKQACAAPQPPQRAPEPPERRVGSDGRLYTRIGCHWVVDSLQTAPIR